MILNKNSQPSFINQITNNGTAINQVVISNNYDIFKRLFSIPGIDLNIYDSNNRTPLINAILGFKLEMMNDILDYYDPENKSFQKQLNEASIELIAIFDRSYNDVQLKVYKKLIEYDFLDVNQYCENQSLFSFACKMNLIEIVQKLLNSKRADVNSTSTSGNTPLFVAMKKLLKN